MYLYTLDSTQTCSNIKAPVEVIYLREWHRRLLLESDWLIPLILPRRLTLSSPAPYIYIYVTLNWDRAPSIVTGHCSPRPEFAGELSRPVR